MTPSIGRVLGYTPDQVLGRSGLDFVHADDLPDVLSQEAEVLASPEAHPTLVVRARHRDGSPRWLEYVLTNRLDDPDIGGVVANIRDITARKRVEQELTARDDQLTTLNRELGQANERLQRTNEELYEANRELARANALKDQFAGTIGHELRGPLSTIVGFAQTTVEMWDRLTEVDKLDSINRIEQNALRLGAIVEDLLLLAQVEAGVLRLHPVPCYVEDAIRDAIEVSTVSTLGVEISCPPALQANVDRRRLSQMLTNYLINAKRHGSPPFAVEARALGEWAEIRVRDGGAGVPAEFLRDLFEPFTQAWPSDAAAIGAGLGLSIVRDLAQAQGGEAWYEANVPKGACFGLRLPAPTAGTG